MKKHIGKITNTDQRCIVVFMQIPGRDDHALVVSTDSLPLKFEQTLIDIVNSPEAQNEASLAPVLNRRLLDNNTTVLQGLHDAGLLRAVHIDQVVMLPLPNMPFPLRGIIDDIKAQNESQPLAEEKYNPHTVNNQALSDETKSQIANNLLIEAELLESEARGKREKAYAYVPNLRPKVAKTPAKLPVVEQKSVERIEVAAVVKPKRKASVKKTA